MSNVVSNHTIRKFEVLEKYIEEWARKLIGVFKKTNPNNWLIFIDCMSNNGVFENKKDSMPILGTPIRAVKVLQKVAEELDFNRIIIYYNDYDARKIAELEKNINTYCGATSFAINYNTSEANEFLNGLKLPKNKHTLLFYDPYKTDINWDTLNPFMNTWGEVIVNHMTIDMIRGKSNCVKEETLLRYCDTYLIPINEIEKLPQKPEMLQSLINDIIYKKTRNYSYGTYVCAFPFHNEKNNIMYFLTLITHNLEGHKLFKKTVWNVFGGKSAIKTPKEAIGQLDFSDCFEPRIQLTEQEDDSSPVYTVDDIARYVITTFSHKHNMSMREIYNHLDEHPIFPTDTYKDEIKSCLKLVHGVQFYKNKETQKEWIRFQEYYE